MTEIFFFVHFLATQQIFEIRCTIKIYSIKSRIIGLLASFFLTQEKLIHSHLWWGDVSYMDQESLLSGRLEKITLQKSSLSLWDLILVAFCHHILSKWQCLLFSCDCLTSWRGQKAGGSGDFVRWEIRPRRAKTGIIHPLSAPQERINQWVAISCVALHQHN